jgi:hypothetical protein
MQRRETTNDADRNMSSRKFGPYQNVDDGPWIKRRVPRMSDIGVDDGTKLPSVG